MRQLEFKSVIWVLVLAVVLGLVTTAFRSRIPPVTRNRLSLANGDFLKRAATQPVDWRFLSADTIAEARRADKPMLLLVGVPASALVAHLDKTFFSDREVASYLNLNFICIRVDGLEDPKWLNAFFPLARLKLEFTPGCQLWVLDPSGKIVSFIGRTSGDQLFTRDALFDALINLRQTYGRVSTGAEPPMGDLVQRNDEALLQAQGTTGLPNFDQYDSELSARIDDTFGGFPKNGIQQLYPGAWQYLLSTGRMAQFRQSINAMLQSPMVDLIDGGFFRLSTSADYRNVEFNKAATENAEMLALLARAPPSPLTAYLLNLTFNALEQRFSTSDSVAAFQVEDESIGGRSARYSFSASRLRSVLSPADRAFAARNLGLDVLRSPQMSAYLSKPETFEDARFAYVLRELRASVNTPLRLSGTDYLEVEAHVCARMIEAARLGLDRARLNRALLRIGRLASFEAKDGLLRHRGETDPGYLGDYLAYADAHLQAYLATGEDAFFHRGLRQLELSAKKFRGARAGEYRLTEGNGPLPATDMPEIADTFRESCSARMARLLITYGRLLGDTPNGLGLQRLGSDVIAHLAPIAAEGGPEVGYFFCAAADQVDGRYAICVGPKARELALDFSRRCPNRLCSPAFGGVRLDLQGLTPGVYIVGSTVHGPYSIERAAAELPNTFDLGPLGLSPQP